jgi:hypothetical protein
VKIIGKYADGGVDYALKSFLILASGQQSVSQFATIIVMKLVTLTAAAERLFDKPASELKLNICWQGFEQGLKSDLFGRRYDIQHNDIQHNDIHHNNIHHNDIQHNDTQHNNIKHYDIQHNNTQHNI